jgi:nucleoside-diphosphate-sugar epimerase
MGEIKNIILTGATGFVGERYSIYSKDKYNIRAVSLQKKTISQVDFKYIDVILHLAGKAHQMQKIDDQIYFDVNYTLTKELADAAKSAGVKHFIFVSTIKVFGEYQKGVLTEKSPCLPQNDPYGESKLKAEQYLQSIEDDNFIVSIIRPPLIYGPGVKGNLIRFLELGNKSYPLPFKNLKNRRTMVFLDNFIELINRIIETKQSGIFLASDESPISTEKLISEIRHNLGKKPNLFETPDFMKKMLGIVKPEFALRLFGSLEMDTSDSFKRLDFKPPYSIEQGIKSMTDWYKSTLS